jgi:hypothetical protein
MASQHWIPLGASDELSLVTLVTHATRKNVTFNRKKKKTTMSKKRSAQTKPM